jgi:hypothetical protein
MKVGDLLLVEWLDSARTEGWHSPAEVSPEPSYCRSVGWMMKKGRDGIVISPHLAAQSPTGEMTDVGGNLAIPNGAIKRTKVLPARKPTFSFS